MARNPLREIVQESLQGKADIQKTFYGYLGDAAGTVIVPGKENYVYVTLADGMVAQAYNTMAPPILNFPVIVGFDPKQARSDLLRVLAVRDIPRIGKQDSAYHTDAHHVSHEWLNAQGGTDVTYIQLRQFMPLRPTPIAPYSINIARDVQMIGSTWQTVGAETIDLTNYVPTTYTGNLGNERFVVLSLNPTTGAVDITSGSMVTAGSSAMSNIPAAPTGNYPICAVRLYTDQIKIVEARSATDLIDLRWGVFASNALLHNALGGLNVGDYQHLTAAQLVVVQNTSGSNTGDQVVPVTTAPVANYYLTGYDGVSGSFASGSVVGGGGGGGGHVIQTSGSDMPAQPNLNFIGATVTNDVSGSATQVAITAGSAVYGSLYAEDVSITNTLTLADTYYPVTTGSFIYGDYSGVTPQNNREIKILTAGTYLVNWSMSITCNASDQTIEGIIMGGSSGSTAQVQTSNATRAKENGVVYSVGGTGFINCAENDIIRFGLENETSAGTVITINHANLAIILCITETTPPPLNITNGWVLDQHINVHGTADLIVASAWSYVDFTGGSALFNTSGSTIVDIQVNMGAGHSVANGTVGYILYLDGVQKNKVTLRTPNTTIGGGEGMAYLDYIASGSHVVNITWAASSGSGYNRNGTEARDLVVKTYIPNTLTGLKGDKGDTGDVGPPNLLSDLLDVSVSGSQADSSALQWSASGSAWNPGLVITSGSYLPTLTNTTNIAASTANTTWWMRVGNVVHVAGICSIDATSAAACVMGISLPIASDIQDGSDLGGVGSITTESARIYGDSTNNRAIMGWTAAQTSNFQWSFTFQYVIR